jgi:hypothetical protein
MRTRTTLVLLSGGLALGLAACGGEETAGPFPAQSVAGDGDLADGGGLVTVETEEGLMTYDPVTGDVVVDGPVVDQSYVSGTTVPEDVPDAPRFEGERIDAANRLDDGRQITWMLSGSLDDPEAAVEQLVADLEGDGWDITSRTTLTDPEFSTLLAAAKDDLALYVTATGGDPNGFSWTIIRPTV